MNKIVFNKVLKDNVKADVIYNAADMQEQFAKGGGMPSLPEVEKHYGNQVFLPAPLEERPYIFSSIALSADGKMAYMDNKKGYLVAGTNARDPEGASMDFWCLNFLRAYSDGLLIGANTLKNEPGVLNYVIDEQLNRERKEVLDKKENPVNILVSLDGTDIPWDHASFDIDPADRVKIMIATSPAGYEYILKNTDKKVNLIAKIESESDIEKVKDYALFSKFDEYPVLVTGNDKNPDPVLMLRALKKMGLDYLCAESPTYTAILMKNRCLDEQFVTYSMVYAGGTMTPGMITPQSCTDHVHSDLVSIGIHNKNFLYTRQKLIYGLK